MTPAFRRLSRRCRCESRVSRRDVVELAEELFSARIATGTVDAILARAADALTEPYDDLLVRMRGARALSVDETGWRTAGERRALWGAFTKRHAFFVLAPDRHKDQAKGLLADTKAIVTSDRWWAYTHLPLARRQLCWSHLKRDFQAHSEGLAAEREFGEVGLELCEHVFWAWEVFAQTNDRHQLKRTVRSLQRSYKPTIRSYVAKRARNRRCRGMAQPAEGLAGAVDVRRPQGHAADQQPRRARPARRGHLPQALARQQSEGGERRIERLLSAHTTCRLQGRSLFDYLTELLAAQARGDPVPLLA